MHRTNIYTYNIKYYVYLRILLLELFTNINLRLLFTINNLLFTIYTNGHRPVFESLLQLLFNVRSFSAQRFAITTAFSLWDALLPLVRPPDAFRGVAGRMQLRRRRFWTYTHTPSWTGGFKFISCPRRLLILHRRVRLHFLLQHNTRGLDRDERRLHHIDIFIVRVIRCWIFNCGVDSGVAPLRTHTLRVGNRR